jgi:LacI family transcriptional regulator
MTATLKDISVRAQTSEATVSLVLNGRHFNRVSLKTREKIESIARELGYVPRRAAQILATGKTHNIGVILNDLSNPFFGLYASLIQQRLWDNGYTSLPMETGACKDRERQLLAWLPQKSVDGIIALESLWGHNDAYLNVQKAAPFVLRHQDNGRLRVGYSHVSVDYHTGVEQLAQHLKQQGWDQVGLLIQTQQLSHDEHQPIHPRTQMLESAMREHGLNCPQPWWYAADESKSMEHWYEQTIAMLKTHPQINALIVHNAIAAPAVYAGVEAVGRSVGKDLAIATFDDNAFTPWLRPGVTVVHEPMQEIADQLVDLLLMRIKNPMANPKLIKVPTQLIVRHSTLRG